MRGDNLNSPLVIDLTGMRFGKLIVVRRVDNDKQGNASWLCKCDCGNEKPVRSNALRNGRTRSCGCLLAQSSKKRMTQMLTKHGYSGSKLYKVYYGMLRRCDNPKEKEYHNYGGRGITVCQEWRENVEQFIEWALNNGYKEGLQIDRKDNDGDYEPGNCRFITTIDNCQNTRKCVQITAFNKVTNKKIIFTIINAAGRELGISPSTIKRMLDGTETKYSDYTFNYLKKG